jgi:glycerate kinase
VRVLIAFDKFKGSLNALQACECAAQALRRKHHDWQLDLCPLTDGGDGFTAILTAAVGGRCVTHKVSGPRGGSVDAAVGSVDPLTIPDAARRCLHVQSRTFEFGRPLAIIDMAAASGLGLLPTEQQDPWQTSSYGTGQLVRAATELNASAILLGVGGSATNDLGLGALAALGLDFRDADASKIRPPTPAQWDRIASIEGEVFTSLPPICLASDVTNVLLGSTGAATIYGAQKGLRSEDLPRMERAMERMARMLCDHCGRTLDLTMTPGAGAAGGLTFGLLTAGRAQIVPGFELVSAWLDLDRRIAAADIVITGEGRFDTTSLSGKGPGAVAERARALGKAIHVFAGSLAENLPLERWSLHAITPAGYALNHAQYEAAGLLARCVEGAF